MGAGDESLPFGMLGDYRLPCVQVVRAEEIHGNTETPYGFVAINRLGYRKSRACIYNMYLRVIVHDLVVLIFYLLIIIILES